VQRSDTRKVLVDLLNYRQGASFHNLLVTR